MSDGGVTRGISRRLGAMGPPSEMAVREALARDDVREAVESTLALYGAEVFGFMTGVVDDPVMARDVYVRFAERMWRAVGRFRWHCSLRTWCYALARSEMARRRAEPPRSARVPSARATLTAGPDVDSLSACTMAGGTLRGRVDILRSELVPEDRELLVLRVDRGFSWRDMALTILDNVSEDEIERESARLRLRFVAVKEQLARAAAAHGITPRPEQSDGNIEDADQRRTDELRGPRGDR
jgi:RNA polymerase sigma-70 factor (ECF subfamily)